MPIALAPPPALDDVDDADLVRAVATRSDRAMAQIWDRHGATLVRAAGSGCGDHQMAADAAQDVLTDLWLSPGDFDPSRGTLAAYLSVRARSRARDLLRSSTARDRRERRVHDDRSSTPVDGDRDQDGAAHRVRHALDHLDEERRAPIVLAYYEGHTYREVARMLDLPEGTVKSRIRSGLKALHRLVGDAAA